MSSAIIASQIANEARLRLQTTIEGTCDDYNGDSFFFFANSIILFLYSSNTNSSIQTATCTLLGDLANCCSLLAVEQCASMRWL